MRKQNRINMSLLRVAYYRSLRARLGHPAIELQIEKVLIPLAKISQTNNKIHNFISIDLISRDLISRG